MQDHIENNKEIMRKKVGHREDNKNLQKRHNRQIDFLLKDEDKITEKMKVLDLGCAEGLFLKRLKEKTNLKYLYGVDISEETINYLNTYYSNIYGYIEDIHNLSFLDKSFDIITCNHTLEHSPNPEQIVKEMYRLLNKNGIILIEIPLESDKKEVGKGKSGHFCTFTDDSFNKLIGKYFKILRSETISFKKNKNSIGILKGEK